MKSLLLTALLAFPALLMGQTRDKKAQDVTAIKSMCGCYSITFDYAETFAEDTSYTLHDPYHASAGAEWIFAEEESEDQIVIQHLLVVGKNTVIKHWRQDWTYENNQFHDFDGDLAWKFREARPDAVSGQWTQLVTQVDDSPRYVGSATWVHVDGKHYWESTTDAPLPRREYTKRNDYNVMQRTNRHEILGNDWLHGQNNLKIVRKDGRDEVLVAEAGRNFYTKIPDEKCKAAQEWWVEHRDFWKLVREEWQDIYAQKDDLFLHKKVDDQLMYQKLFAMDKALAEKAKKSPKKVRREINAALKQFITTSRESHSATY